MWGWKMWGTATHSSATGLNPVCAAFLRAAQWLVGECLKAKPTAEGTDFC